MIMLQEILHEDSINRTRSGGWCYTTIHIRDCREYSNTDCNSYIYELGVIWCFIRFASSLQPRKARHTGHKPLTLTLGHE